MSAQRDCRQKCVLMFMSRCHQHYRGSNPMSVVVMGIYCCLQVYDITDRDTLERVRHWVKELRTMARQTSSASHSDALLIKV